MNECKQMKKVIMIDQLKPTPFGIASIKSIIASNTRTAVAAANFGCSVI